MLELLLVGIATGVLFSWVFYGAGFPDGDSFYHARISALIAEHGLLYTFPWLQETSLATTFTDHHLLYHLLVAPLTWLVSPAIAITIVQVVLLMALAMLIYLILKQQQLPYPGLVLVALVMAWPFMVRMTLVKASPLALLFVLLLTWLMLQSRTTARFWVASIAMGLYTMVHGGFALIYVVGICLWLGRCIAESIQQRRLVLARPQYLWAIVFGSVLGVVMNPYFPQNLQFYWLQLVQIGVVNYQEVISVGSEWYPFSLQDLIAAINMVMILWVLTIVVLVRHRSKYAMDGFLWGVGIVCVVLLLATLRSRRFVEYVVPFLVWWTAYVLLPYIKSGVWRKDLLLLRQEFSGWLVTGVVAYTIIGGILAFAQSLTVTYTGLRGEDSYSVDQFKATAEVIANHSDAGDVVFHNNWDHFPMLFYHNWENNYLVGLDPTFMYLHNQNNYQLWQELLAGEYKSDSARVIVDAFDARYVFIDSQRPLGNTLAAYLLRDANVEQLFNDGRTWVFYIHQ